MSAGQWKRYTQQVLSLLILAGSALTPAFSWEGRWTNGHTGTYPLPDTYDPYNGSHTESGIEIKDRIQRFYLPPNPQFEDVDPDEIADNEGKDYSPYALLRLSRAIELYGQKVDKGYYQVKIGTWRSGSPRQKSLMATAGMQEATLTTAGTPSIADIRPKPPDDSQSQTESPVEPQPDTGFSGKLRKKADALNTALAKKTAMKSLSRQPSYTVLIFKKNGKVILMAPIERRQLVVLPWKQGRKLPKLPMAWVEANANRPDEPPVLHYYYKHLHYIAQLGQA